MPKGRKAVKKQLIEARIAEFEAKGEPADAQKIAAEFKTSAFYVYHVKKERAKRLAAEKVSDALKLLNQ